jgi:hypothetical protein
MKKLMLALISFTISCGASSENKADPNEKNFKAALSQYFEKKGELCLEVALPQDTFADAKGDVVDQMAALAAVGMVQGTDIERDGTNFVGNPTGKKQKLKRYTPTEAAKPFMSEIKFAGIVPAGYEGEPSFALCWGKKAPDKIVKWDGPIALGSYQEVKVTYTYKIEPFAEWAKNPAVQAAFKSVKSAIDNAGKLEDYHALKLTSQGWEALGLDSKR